MHQKQCLTRQRDGTPIPYFTEPHFRHLYAGARGFTAPAPVRHTVHAANGVRPKTLHRARWRRYPAAYFLPLVTGDVIGCHRGEDTEGEDGDKDGEVKGFEDLGRHDLGEASL